MPIAPSGAIDGSQNLFRADAADVPQRIFEHALLRRELRRRIEMLQAAAAAGAEMRTPRRDARWAGGVQLGNAGELVTWLATQHLDRGAFTNQRAFDEHGLAVDTRDTASLLVESSDDNVHKRRCSRRMPPVTTYNFTGKQRL